MSTRPGISGGQHGETGKDESIQRQFDIGAEDRVLGISGIEVGGFNGKVVVDFIAAEHAPPEGVVIEIDTRIRSFQLDEAYAAANVESFGKRGAAEQQGKQCRKEFGFHSDFLQY